jgi:transposase
MFSLNEAMRYYLYAGATDLRKGFDSLQGLVTEGMGRDPLSGEVFLFVNRGRNSLKLLHWERGGMVLYHKRLEKGRFALPEMEQGGKSCRMEWRDLVLMVEGIKPGTATYGKRLENVGKAS